jgi:2-oxoglutarate dehydrogenase E2 component (dihydrolipoamide succinyltransferase)
MTIEVKVPQLPESVTDATLVAWHKSPGDSVQRDENLVDLETDKVVLEVPAPTAGIIQEIRIQNGATVTGGELLATLEPAAPGIAPAPAEKAAAPAAVPAAAAARQAAPARMPAASPEPAAEPGVNAGKLSPSVRRLLEEHDVDATQVHGTGKGGRILKSDVIAFLDQRVQPETDTEDMPIIAAGTPAAAAQRREHRVPMTRLRARIAERMVEAQHTAAMLTTFNEVDLSAVMNLRKRYQEQFEAEHGVRLGFMSFFVKASIEALRRFPVVNASVEDQDIVYHDYFDIGIAVSTERGLLVPVIRDADRLGFAGLESTINEYGVKARQGSISMDELTGGTFTVTNGGVFGSMLSTPILNPPQSGILGMHKIQQRPVVVDGEVVPRPMMYVALTYDHRIVDGREAVQFLVALKDCLEDPSRMLLQI